MELWAAQLEVLVNSSGTKDRPVTGVHLSGVTVAHTQVDWGLGPEGSPMHHPWEELSNGDHVRP